MSFVAPADRPRTTHPATSSQLDWLASQLALWQSEGLVGPDQARSIVGRYHVERRLPVTRLLLTLGAVFVGLGVIWLVAANLNGLSPAARFATVSIFWLGCLSVGEVLAARRGDAARAPKSSALVGAVRLLAALAFGAVVFQAAQSLQVPAYEPALVGCWALGALVHAYAVRAVMPLVVAILAGSTWFLWQVLAATESGLAVVVCLLTAGVLGVAVAALHGRWARELGPPWREVGAAFVLGGLFVAALPDVDANDFEWTTTLVVVVALAGVGAAAAVVLAPNESRLEVLVAAAAAGAAVGLVLWDAGGDDRVTAGGAAGTVVGVAVYVLVTIGVAVVGALRDSWRLTALASAALVVFTTVQSFSV
ncbi:MAG TPA: DUF2157 domain-containing protein, partial [Nocardioides sp.]|uniref:DUF2157 domain-containing protein n=1 Tax=Nocardioides sp. TaxID=35761 RepID=UPI002E3192D4